MEIKERFLNYVNFDTQSDSYSHTVPSTSKQLKLGNYLVEELKSLGIENAKINIKANGTVTVVCNGTEFTMENRLSEYKMTRLLHLLDNERIDCNEYIYNDTDS